MNLKESPLDSVLSKVIDYRGKTPKKTNQGIRLITAKIIKNGKIENNGRQEYIAEDSYEDVMRRGKPQKNDIFITTEAPLGELAIWKSEERIALAQRVILLRPNQNLIDPDFLFHYLKSDKFQSELNSHATGTTVLGIKNPVLRSLPIKYPKNRNDQKKIGSILSSYDDLISINQRRIALLEEAARRLYREWFVHLRFPGHESVPVQDGVPQGWTTQNLIDIAPLSYGKALKASDRRPGNIPVYGSSGVVGYHNAAYINEGAIIIGRKGNIGSVFLSHTPCFPIDTVFFIPPERVSYWLYFSVQELNFISSDSAVPGLNRNYAHSLPLLLPDTRTIRAFEELATPLFAQIHLLTYQNTLLAKARDLLLPRLMSGKLDVSNIPLPEEVLA